MKIEMIIYSPKTSGSKNRFWNISDENHGNQKAEMFQNCSFEVFRLLRACFLLIISSLALDMLPPTAAEKNAAAQQRHHAVIYKNCI